MLRFKYAVSFLVESESIWCTWELKIRSLHQPYNLSIGRHIKLHGTLAIKGVRCFQLQYLVRWEVSNNIHFFFLNC